VGGKVSGFVDVGALADFVAGSAAKVVVGDVKVAVIRIGDDVYAIGDTCSHAEISLAEGELFCEELEIECWKHGSSFSLVTGEPQTLPATQPVPVFVARVTEGRVLIGVEAGNEGTPA
jgi:3-phenylpropionate/trans-cinnamate dioxygenase ferredoxin component